MYQDLIQSNLVTHRYCRSTCTHRIYLGVDIRRKTGISPYDQLRFDFDEKGNFSILAGKGEYYILTDQATINLPTPMNPQLDRVFGTSRTRFAVSYVDTGIVSGVFIPHSVVEPIELRQAS